MSELPTGDEYAARLRVLAERVNGFVYAGDRLDAVVDTVRALRADPELARALLSGVPFPSEPPREQVDPTSLGIDDLTDAERDAFVALAEHREETP